MGYTFVLGGARSGKSSYAEQLTAKWAEEQGLPVTYLATSEVTDAEMAERINRHQERRPSNWKTVEVPVEVAAWLRENRQPQIVLVDCLSLLLNNWMFYEKGSGDQISEGSFSENRFTDDRFIMRVQELVDACKSREHPLILVSNEVGLGLVPPDPVSRQYRDWLGLLNQAIAKEAESVYYLVAGIPITIK